MSINVPPPEFQFTGLFYNPNWWITSSTSLSQAVANTLYLRKTTTDSASALETFNAGIKSTGYDVVTAGTTQNMFSTQTANTNLFGNMGAGQTLKLGNQTIAQSVHVSNIDCNGNTINNATSPAVGNLSIGSAQTTGDIFLGGSGRTTGAINIYRSLTPLYTSAPTTGQIGYTFKLTNNFTANQNFTSGSDLNVCNMTNFSAGTWFISGAAFIRPAATTAIQYVNASIAGTYTTFNIVSAGNYVVNTDLSPPITGIFYSNGTTTLTITYRAGFTVSTLTLLGGQTAFNIYATRIA